MIWKRRWKDLLGEEKDVLLETCRRVKQSEALAKVR